MEFLLLINTKFLLLLLTVLREKWAKSQTKTQKSSKDDFIWEIWWPVRKSRRSVPYTGELGCMVLVWFPFCTFSSLSLSLSKHPFKLYKPIKYRHIKYTLPCIQKLAKTTSSKQFASRGWADHENYSSNSSPDSENWTFNLSLNNNYSLRQFSRSLIVVLYN